AANVAAANGTLLVSAAVAPAQRATTSLSALRACTTSSPSVCSQLPIHRSSPWSAAKLSRMTMRTGGIAASGLRWFERLGLEVGAQAADHVDQIAVEQAGQVVPGQADAVVSQAILREIVGADLLRAIAGADLAAPRVALRGLTLLFLDLVKLRAQQLHRHRAVLVLRLFLLAVDDEPARQVVDAYGGVGGVDRLPSGSARSHHVDLQILGIDVDLDVLDLGHHRDGRGRRVDAPLRLGRGHALHAVNA